MLYAIIVMIVGIVRRSASSRRFALALFGVVVAKVFLYDTANLDNDFYRFISYISLGIILVLAGYLYYRFRDRILQFIEVGKPSPPSRFTSPVN